MLPPILYKWRAKIKIKGTHSDWGIGQKFKWLLFCWVLMAKAMFGYLMPYNRYHGFCSHSFARCSIRYKHWMTFGAVPLIIYIYRTHQAMIANDVQQSESHISLVLFVVCWHIVPAICMPARLYACVSSKSKLLSFPHCLFYRINSFKRTCTLYFPLWFGFSFALIRHTCQANIIVWNV